MLTVATVLRSGGDYRPEHVDALRSGISRNLAMEHRFVCLTDMEVNCEAIPLVNGWPGWWSKIELFRPGIFSGPVVYADLDTIVVGSLDSIVTGHQFTVLGDFYRPEYIGSGLMAWSIDLSAIYAAFGPGKHMVEYRTRRKWGDQGFISDHSPVVPDRWQQRHPGKVVSYKVDCLKTGRVPSDASVICFHGQPRPWQTTLWKEAA